jgi:ATP-binding cassette subfamily A (ABC1) protein 3
VFLLIQFGTIQVKALLRKEAVLDRRRPNLIAVGLSLLAVFALYCTWAVLAQSKGLAHFWDKYGTFVGQQSPLLMCPLLINTLLKLGYEKRSGTKSLMLQMGLQQRTYFMSYVVHELAWSLPLTLVLALLSWATMFGGTISGFLPVWLWFLFYYISAIPSNFLLTSLISSDKYLVVFGVIWFYFLAILVTVDPDGNGNLEAKICLSILFPSANFAFATNSFRAFLQPEDAYVNPELRGVSAGSMWRIIDDQDLTDPEGTYNATSNMSLGLLYGMSMLNLALLSFLALWFEQVKPFEKDAGDRQSPFFFFKYIAALRSLIPGRAPRRPRLLSADVTEILAADEFEVCCVPVEKIPADLRAAARSGSGVCIRELRKSYPDPVTGRSFNAVNRLTLTMYQGQVTCLLGHNGAGKSSTLNCLTGNISITGGEVYVNGKSVRKEVREIQKMIGVCPQKNFLHDKLTVEQHLELFAGLKGLEGDDSRRHVNEIVARLDLEPKRHFLARNLSGGQKRKLHVGMAFMGGSRVVFLGQSPVHPLNPLPCLHPSCPS